MKHSTKDTKGEDRVKIPVDDEKYGVWHAACASAGAEELLAS